MSGARVEVDEETPLFKSLQKSLQTEFFQHGYAGILKELLPLLSSYIRRDVEAIQKLSTSFMK